MFYGRVFNVLNNKIRDKGEFKLKSLFAKILFMLLAAVIAIPTVGASASEVKKASTSKQDVQFTYNPTELQKLAKEYSVPSVKEKGILNAAEELKGLENGSSQDQMSTMGAKSAAAKEAIKVIRGLANNAWAKDILGTMFGKSTVNKIIKNTNKICKVLEDITGAPKEVAAMARKQIPPAIKGAVGAGVAETIGMAVEYIILAADYLVL
ncbi:hypothetical protein AUL54_00480 [Bacillus sp. SDLI1]|uniref:Uncharacterized protein n=1 Tax=Bacillus siamensis TaxID=659243 RepID=A0AAI8HNR4_9BACI|nr:hypothetical protein AUL54_00480 [Bacillus sp. SDLI1]AUJ77314.1 hypothetical protein CWD84_11070 [Bacillus siamensis]